MLWYTTDQMAQSLHEMIEVLQEMRCTREQREAITHVLAALPLSRSSDDVESLGTSCSMAGCDAPPAHAREECSFCGEHAAGFDRLVDSYQEAALRQARKDHAAYRAGFEAGLAHAVQPAQNGGVNIHSPDLHRFLATDLGRIAQQRGWIETLISLKYPRPPTVATFRGLVGMMLADLHIETDATDATTTNSHDGHG